MANAVSAGLTERYTAAAGRKFGLTVGGAFVVLSIIARWRGHPTSTLVFGTLAGALILGALVAPTMLGPVERGWMKGAHAISKVTTPIFMGVVYFIVLTPIGLLRRAFAGSALVHKAGPHGLWADRTQSPRSALDRQF